MLKHAMPAQNETFERLRVLFSAVDIKFTLVGAAACREHGLPRPTDDLDIVVSPYATAIDVLSRSGEFIVCPESVDWTSRTCTQRHVKTAVLVDFLTGGIRINDHTFLPGGVIYDPLPIPNPSGCGNIADVPTLIAMKVSTVISSMEILRFGATTGVRTREETQQDIEDVVSLISTCELGRDLPLGNEAVQRKYQEIYDNCKS
jgi:hypothetical protein